MGLDVASGHGVGHCCAIDAGCDLVARLKWAEQGQLLGKACPGHHGTAAQQMDVGAAFERDVATVITGSDRAAFQDGQAGAGIDQNGRIAAAVDTGKQAGGAVNRVRGFNLELAVGRQCLDGAALVSREAVDLGAIGDKAAFAGAGQGLTHLHVDQLVGNQPAHDEHLLIHIDQDFRPGDARVWRTQRVTLVLPLHLEGAGVERKPLAGLHIADNFHAVAQNGRDVVQTG